MKEYKICENCNTEIEFDRGFDSVVFDCPHCGKTFRCPGYRAIFYAILSVCAIFVFIAVYKLNNPYKEKNSPYMYEDGFFVSYQEKYDTVWAKCELLVPVKIEGLRSEYSKRVAYEEFFKEHYSPPQKTNTSFVVHLKNSIRNMKPDSSEQQQHSAMVDLADACIAVDNLLYAEVSASTFLYELNSIEKNYVEALRKVELNISPE